MKVDVADWLETDPNLHEELLRERMLAEIIKVHVAKEAQVGNHAMRHLEKSLMLTVLDDQWREHLATMDYLRQSIHLRGYAQKDPKQEYKREAFVLFSDMLESMKREVISLLTRVQLQKESDVDEIDRQWREEPRELQFTHADAPRLTANPNPKPSADQTPDGEMKEDTFDDFGNKGVGVTYTRGGPKVGRNDPCPCGSKLKYKQCHGKLE